MSFGKSFEIDVHDTTKVIRQARNHGHIAVCCGLTFKLGPILGIDFGITDSDIDGFFLDVFGLRERQFRILIDAVVIAAERDRIALDRGKFFPYRFDVRQAFKFVAVVRMDSRIQEPHQKMPEIFGPIFLSSLVELVERYGVSRIVPDIEKVQPGIVLRKNLDNIVVELFFSGLFRLRRFFFVDIFERYDDMVLGIRRFCSLETVKYRLTID